jgi:predicted dinucleotide-binding enzyme
MTVADAVAHSDIVVLAVPSYRFRELPQDAFSGKVLIDTINYWEQTDGVVADFVDNPGHTSEAVQRHFASARVVKSLNQLGYHQFNDERLPPGTPGRIAMAAAGNDRDAVAQVLALIDDLGFDPIDAGTLADGAQLGPGGPAFGVVAQKRELLRLLGLEVTV